MRHDFGTFSLLTAWNVEGTHGLVYHHHVRRKFFPFARLLYSSTQAIGFQAQETNFPPLLQGAREQMATIAETIHDGGLESSNSLTDFTSNARTRGSFKPRNANKGTSSYQLRQFAEATLGSGSLRKAVKLPEGEDLSEWLAVNGIDTSYENLAKYCADDNFMTVVDFYNQINLLYGSITEFCSPQSCPEMKATDE